MKFINTAIEMEESTLDYYLDLAEKCAANEGLKKILRMLAKDHAQHLVKFQQMSNKESTDLDETDAFESTIDYFRNLQQDKEIFSCDIDQLSMYQKALDLVGKKLVFYHKCESDLDNQKNKAILGEIIKEENQHRYVLQNIIEMISRPLEWIENAEFNHIVEY